MSETRDQLVDQLMVLDICRGKKVDWTAPNIDYRLKLVEQWLADHPQPGATSDDIEELRRYMKDPDIMDAHIAVVRKGLMFNSGQRRKAKISGAMLIVWLPNAELHSFLEDRGV